jgi:hydroxyacylglutathione hydrolase
VAIAGFSGFNTRQFFAAHARRSQMLRITTVRAFADNYLWLVHGSRDPARVAVVDPGDAAAIDAALAAADLQLDTILVTHHHADHTGGVQALAASHGAPVIGPAQERIPARTRGVRQGDVVELEALGLRFEVLEVPGHTAGHVAYAGHGAVFCGDTLFSGGCGRLFEGTAAQMQGSLDRIAALPDDTRIYCAHEYTASNLRFAAVVEPDNADLRGYTAEVNARRARDEQTVPAVLGLERRINPFLRSRVPAVRAAAENWAGAPLPTPADVLGAVRRWKDGFT